jgi:peptide/nickel transport system substrate-binding protein
VAVARAVAGLTFVATVVSLDAQRPPPHTRDTPEPGWLVTTSSPGTAGGRLVTALRAEPRTFNPVVAVDSPSRDIVRRLHADLVTIDRATQRTSLALARSVDVAPDGRRITVHLRRGLRFSDGMPFGADDVVFSFSVYMDEAVGSPQRELLVIDGKPVRVTKIDDWTVAFDFAAPYGPSDRIFDSVAILPKHILEAEYRAGVVANAWSTGVDPTRIVGLGPYRLRSYQAGQAVVLERNPYYFKRDARGGRLPYLDELRFVFAANEDAQALRFEAGDLDIVDRMGGEPFARLTARSNRDVAVRDLGPGLDYTFLLFNLNDLPPTAPESLRARQRWFADREFRRAVSLAIDRPAIARLVYAGRATPIAWHVTPGNHLWYNQALRPSIRSTTEAKRLLAARGFTWTSAGKLRGPAGTPVAFSILTSGSNTQRSQTLTVVKADLEAIGIEASIVTLEFAALVERVMRTHDYDAAIMALGSGDVDPGADLNVWRSDGATHLWRLKGAPTPAETEVDSLLVRLMTTTDREARRAAFDHVQALVASELPVVPLVAPHVLVGVPRTLENVRPGIIDHHLLWNADELYWRGGARARR